MLRVLKDAHKSALNFETHIGSKLLWIVVNVIDTFFPPIEF